MKSKKTKPRLPSVKKLATPDKTTLADMTKVPKACAFLESKGVSIKPMSSWAEVIAAAETYHDYADFRMPKKSRKVNAGIKAVLAHTTNIIVHCDRVVNRHDINAETAEGREQQAVSAAESIMRHCHKGGVAIMFRTSVVTREALIEAAKQLLAMS